MAQSPLNDTTQPVESEDEGQSPTMDRWKKHQVEHKIEQNIRKKTEIISFLSLASK